MWKLYVKWRNFRAKLNEKQSQRGQSMTEYTLILALVAVATIVTWQLFGPEIKNMLTTVINALRNAQQ